MNVISFVRRALQGSSGGAVQVADDQPLPVSSVDGLASLTKSAVAMTGSSAELLAASATRSIVVVSNAEANASAAIDPTGGTCSLTAGIPLPPGATVRITGKAAQAAMTQIGTNGQSLTVYAG